MTIKYKIIVFAASALFAVFASAMAVYAKTSAVITEDGVNVRSTPDKSSPNNIIRQLNAGDSIDILDRESGGWYKITDPSMNCGYTYVYSDYVQLLQIDGVVNDDRVNIREQSSTDSSVLGVLNKGDRLTVTGSEGDFYMFSQDGMTRYIYKGFVDLSVGFNNTDIQEQDQVDIIDLNGATETSDSNYTYGKVISDIGLNFRKEPSLGSDVYFGIGSGELVDIIDATGDWYKVSYSGVEGYLKGEFVELHTGVKPQVDERAQKANAVVSFAENYLGTPYVYGGTSLTSGVDCSGFTYSVYRNFGYALDRSSCDQAYDGVKVSKSDLQPGDLIFFDTNLTGTISHVGMYIGNGQFIQSCSGVNSMCVKIDSLSESYYAARYMTARRIITG